MADKTHLPKRRRGWRKGNPLTEEMRAHAQLRKTPHVRRPRGAHSRLNSSYGTA
jgi:hypothetical protein